MRMLTSFYNRTFSDRIPSKVIFIQLAGVLCPTDDIYETYDKTASSELLLSKDCLESLCDIINQTQSKVVIIGRLSIDEILNDGLEIQRLQSIISKDVIGFMSTYGSILYSGDLVDSWINAYRFNGEYVILDTRHCDVYKSHRIDQLNFVYENHSHIQVELDWNIVNSHHIEHLIICDDRLGLTKDDSKKAIDILNNN